MHELSLKIGAFFFPVGSGNWKWKIGSQQCWFPLCVGGRACASLFQLLPLHQLPWPSHSILAVCTTVPKDPFYENTIHISGSVIIKFILTRFPLERLPLRVRSQSEVLGFRTIAFFYFEWYNWSPKRAQKTEKSGEPMVESWNVSDLKRQYLTCPLLTITLVGSL